MDRECCSKLNAYRNTLVVVVIVVIFPKMFIYIFTHLFENSDFSWKNNFLEGSTFIYRSNNYKKCIVLDLRGSSSLYREFSYDVTAAILVFQNNGTAAMLVYLDNPVGVEFFSYVKTFFCSNKLA